MELTCDWKGCLLPATRVTVYGCDECDIYVRFWCTRCFSVITHGVRGKGMRCVQGHVITDLIWRAFYKPGGYGQVFDAYGAKL